MLVFMPLEFLHSGSRLHIPEVFVEVNSQILTFTWKCKGLRVAKDTLKSVQVEGHTSADFKSYKAVEIKKVW